MKLLNEVGSIDDILNGVNLDPYRMRYMCRLLTRYYYGQGVVDQKEIRRLIFTWANQHHMYIKLSLKHLIAQEIDIYRPINNGTAHISINDIEGIKKFTHKKVMRKSMVGFLCYAKIFAIDNVIDVCIKDLANWMGYTNMSNFYNYQMKELLRLGFIRDLEDPNKYEQGHITKCTRKLYVNWDCSNIGEYNVDDNNYQDVCESIDWS